MRPKRPPPTKPLFVIDEKAALLYAGTLHGMLTTGDVDGWLSDPAHRAVLVALTKDLSHAIPGKVGDDMRAMIGRLES